MRPTGPVRALAGLPRAAERQIIGTRKPVIRGIPGSNQFGDMERSMLRPGNVHSAESWREVLEPVIARYRERGLVLYFRGDAAFAKPELYQLPWRVEASPVAPDGQDHGLRHTAC